MQIACYACVRKGTDNKNTKNHCNRQNEDTVVQPEIKTWRTGGHQQWKRGSFGRWFGSKWKK